MPEWSSRRVGQAGFALLGAALMLAFAVTLVHASQDVFYIPAYGVGIAAGAFVLAAVGWGLSLRAGHLGFTALTMLTVGCFVVGGLALHSIGVLLVAVSLALLAVVKAKLSANPDRRSALPGAVLLGLGAPVLAVLSLSPPLVDCERGSSGENIFLGFESSSGGASASGSADGRTQTGSSRGDDYEYTYRCRDGELLQFDFRRR